PPEHVGGCWGGCRWRPPQRCHRHDGGGWRDVVGARDRERVGGAGQPQRARASRGAGGEDPGDGKPTDVEGGRGAEEPADSAATEPIVTESEAETPPEAAEFEGPRRRARRERAERRAAQARATAIEEARREAKRRASGRLPEKPKPVARGVVR